MSFVTIIRITVFAFILCGVHVRNVCQLLFSAVGACVITINALIDATLCCRCNAMVDQLAGKAMLRLHLAFRSKTSKAYSAMFEVFLAFCIYMKVSIWYVSVKVVLAFIECLVCNKASPVVVANYVSAIKAKCILYYLSYHVCDNVKIKYFLKSVKINRPLIIINNNSRIYIAQN